MIIGHVSKFFHRLIKRLLRFELLGVSVKGRKRDSFKTEDRIGAETSQLTRNYSEPTLLTMCIIQSIIAEETEEELLKRYSNIMEKRYEFSAGEVFDIETTARQDVKLYKEEYDNSLLIRNSPLVALYGDKTNYERLNMKKNSHSICIPLV